MRETLAHLRERLVPVRDIYRRLDALEGRSPPPPEAAPSGQPVIIHLHVAKTAGTSLNKALFAAFDGRPSASYVDTEWPAFTRSPQAERHRLALLVGHMNYGVHEHLRPNYLYLFLVREPRARIFSYFRYLSTREDHPLFPIVGGAALSFGAFLDLSKDHRDLRADLDNRQVHQIAGGDHLPGEAFRVACRHAFDERSMFGVSERLGPFLSAIAARDIIPEATEHRENTTGSHERLDNALSELTSAQRSLLDAYCQWDDRFYQVCDAAAP